MDLMGFNRSSWAFDRSSWALMNLIDFNRSSWEKTSLLTEINLNAIHMRSDYSKVDE